MSNFEASENLDNLTNNYINYVLFVAKLANIALRVLRKKVRILDKFFLAGASGNGVHGTSVKEGPFAPSSNIV